MTTRYHFTFISMATLKIQEIRSVDKDVEKREILYTVDENVNGMAAMENSMVVFHNIKIKQLYDPVILLLDVYTKKVKS